MFEAIEFFSESAIVSAHSEAATANRVSIEASETCGCFYCGDIFPAREVGEWVWDREGDTALCPHCGIDSVIGDASGYPVDKPFLAAMNQYWFG